jgi:hypothetical protein
MNTTLIILLVYLIGYITNYYIFYFLDEKSIDYDVRKERFAWSFISWFSLVVCLIFLIIEFFSILIDKLLNSKKKWF